MQSILFQYNILCTGILCKQNKYRNKNNFTSVLQIYNIKCKAQVLERKNKAKGEGILCIFEENYIVSAEFDLDGRI